jgi:hypothetical protein
MENADPAVTGITILVGATAARMLVALADRQFLPAAHVDTEQPAPTAPASG